MGTCSVCRHADREDVDRALLGGASLRDVAGRFRLSRSALQRHRAHHLAGPVAAAAERQGLTLAALARDLGEVHAGTLGIFRRALARGDRRLALQAGREVRGGVDVLARLAGVAPLRVEVAAAEPVPMETQRERAASVLAILHTAGVLTLTAGSGEPGAPEDDGEAWEPPGEPAGNPASPADTPAELPGFPGSSPPPPDPLAAYPWLREDGVADLRNHF